MRLEEEQNTSMRITIGLEDLKRIERQIEEGEDSDILWPEDGDDAGDHLEVEDCEDHNTKRTGLVEEAVEIEDTEIEDVEIKDTEIESNEGDIEDMGKESSNTPVQSDLACDTKQDKKRRKTKKKKSIGKRIAVSIGILLIALGLTFANSLGREYFDHTSEDGETVEVVIPEGASTKSVAKILKEDGLLRYETVFLMKMYTSPYRGKLRYGTFVMHKGMCVDDVIKTLATDGGVRAESMFTVPEGFTIEKIAKKLEDDGIMTGDEFLNAVKSATDDFTYKSVLPDETKVYYQLQGYLFPDTYAIDANTTGESLVQMMLAEFENKFDETRQEKAKKAGLTVEEVLIRASLVQKETDLEEEYPMIAGVIENRLKQGMKMQFDSTVVYAMTEGQYGVDRVMYADLEFDSPYNTYKNKGLPPGPICNPSLAAIDAVLEPAVHEYLYFQTDKIKNDGSNIFSKTYEEHLAVTKEMNGESASTEKEATTEKTSTTEKTTADKANEKESVATTEKKTTTENADKKAEATTQKQQ